MPLPSPQELLGSAAALAPALAVGFLILLALLANERHAGAFAVVLGAAMLALMEAGWLPYRPELAVVVIIMGAAALVVEQKRG